MHSETRPVPNPEGIGFGLKLTTPCRLHVEYPITETHFNINPLAGTGDLEEWKARSP